MLLRLITEENARIQTRKEQERRATEQEAATAPSVLTPAAAPTNQDEPAERWDVVEVSIPPARDLSWYNDIPIHVDAYLVTDVVDLLQALAVIINPHDHDAADYPRMYRLRAAIRRLTACLEEALAAHDEVGYGVQCRAKVTDLDEGEARRAAATHTASGTA